MRCGGGLAAPRQIHWGDRSLRPLLLSHSKMIFHQEKRGAVSGRPNQLPRRARRSRYLCTSGGSGGGLRYNTRVCSSLERISRERVTDLLWHLSLLNRISVRCLIASSSTAFSLWAFSLVRRSKPHRLKPVLLECAGPA